MLSAVVSNQTILIVIALLLLGVNIFLTIRLQKSIKSNKSATLPEAVCTDTSQVDAQTTAAIMAAVAAVIDAESQATGGTPPKFIVKHIKKVKR